MLESNYVTTTRGGGDDQQIVQECCDTNGTTFNDIADVDASEETFN